MKIEQYLWDLKDKMVDKYQQGGVDKVNEFCVYSNINLIAAYTIINTVLDDDKIKQKISDLRGFYDN